MTLLVALLLACTSPAPAPVAPPPPQVSALPDIVIVVIDTARRDRLSTYGYERPTSPQLDKFAKHATVYDNAYSTSSWTAPAHASMFTGTFPAHHHTNQEHWDLMPEHDTLAEQLRHAGYDTYGVVGNGMIAQKRGFGQGFDRYVEAYKRVKREAKRNKKKGRAKPIADDAKKPPPDPMTAKVVKNILSKRESADPYFLFVNLIGPHSPYDSCGQSCGTFADLDPETSADNQWAEYYLGQVSPTEDDLHYLSDLYDNEIVEADRHLGMILKSVRDYGRPNNTLIIVTSDHGEQFGEHGHIDHVFSLYEPVVQIPLVIQWPGEKKKKRVEEAVQLVDVAPTVLTAAEVDWEGMHGVDLHAGPPEDRPVFLEYYEPVQAFEPLEEKGTPEEVEKLAHLRRRTRALIDASDKLHWDANGKRELYDLAADPTESTDLIGIDDSHTEKQQALESELDTLQAAYADGALPEPEQGASEVDEDTKEALQELGYLADDDDKP